MVPQHDRFGKQFHKYVLHILPGSNQFLDFCRHIVLKRNAAAIARSGVPASQRALFESLLEIPLSANWSTEQDAKQSLSTNGCCGLWLALRPRWPGPASQEASIAHALGSQGIYLATWKRACLGGPGRQMADFRPSGCKRHLA